MMGILTWLTDNHKRPHQEPQLSTETTVTLFQKHFYTGCASNYLFNPDCHQSLVIVAGIIVSNIFPLPQPLWISPQLIPCIPTVMLLVPNKYHYHSSLENLIAILSFEMDTRLEPSILWPFTNAQNYTILWLQMRLLCRQNCCIF
jgi:hypothetical protein